MHEKRVLRPTHSVIRTVCISPPFPWHAQSNLNLSHSSEWPPVAWPEMRASILVSQVEKLRLTARRKGRTKLPQKSATRMGENPILFPFLCPLPNCLIPIATNHTNKSFARHFSSTPACVCSKTSMTCPTLTKANKEIHREKGRTGLKWELWRSKRG